MSWFRNYAFGSHTGEWLALAIVIFISFASCVASLKLVFWLLTRKRDTDESESEREYWLPTRRIKREPIDGILRANLDLDAGNEGSEFGVTAQGERNIPSGASTQMILQAC